MSKRVFGEIRGISVGRVFADRKNLSRAGVHRPPQAGISGAENEGADSIVLSGGYEDDRDLGDVILYTGRFAKAGGRSNADASKQGSGREQGQRPAGASGTGSDPSLTLLAPKGIPLRRALYRRGLLAR